MIKREKTVPRFAICIKSDDPDLLTPRMIYQVLSDESAERSNYLRVIDNEGEDYLYPAEHFVFVTFPQGIKQALQRISHPVSPNTPVRQPLVSPRQRKLKQKPA